MSSRTNVRRWQDRLKPIQNHIGSGCNLNRDIAGPIEGGSPCITKLDCCPGEPKALGAMQERFAVVS